MHRIRSHQPVRTLRPLAMLLILAALFASGTTLYAQPKDTEKTARNDDPHSIVSSDGTVPVAATDTKGKEAISQSFEGTGTVVDGGRRTVNETPVGAAAAPGQEVGIESVIGTDNRYQITSTTTFPYRALTHITSSIGGCSGWLINANTVVTAGHCVYGNGGWATNVRVYPGRSGSSTPYGSCGSRRLYAVSGWTTSRNRDYDYAAIKLDCTIGNTTGYLGYRYSTTSLTGQPSYTAGYPGDKTYATMWRSDDSIRITQTRRLYYANDTYGGQSGSAVWNNEASCSTCGIAVHAYGVDGTGYNGGTRITQEVYNNLTTWKNAP